MKNILLLPLLLMSTSYATSIKTLTINLGAITPYSSQVEKNIKKFCLEVNRQEYDLIFLQEVWIEQYRSLIKKECLLSYHLDLDTKFGLLRKYEQDLLENISSKFIVNMVNSLFPSFAPDSGLMILSRYPLQNKKRLIFSSNGIENNLLDGEFTVSKGAIGATITHPEIGNIFIATTHLISNYPEYSYHKQSTAQLHELQKWTDKQKKTNPIILGGDFNIAPPLKDTKNYLNTDKLWPLLKFNLFKNMNFTQFRSLSMITYPGPTKETREGLVDHILISKSLSFDKTRIVFKDKVSDHYGIKTNISPREK